MVYDNKIGIEIKIKDISISIPSCKQNRYRGDMWCVCGDAGCDVDDGQND